MVEALLHELDQSHRSFKRLAGRATGAALQVVGPGERGDLSLFLTLEGLQIGVQGKRCLWRALQALPSPALISHRERFADLEADAVRQWDELDGCRCRLVPQTFA